MRLTGDVFPRNFLVLQQIAPFAERSDRRPRGPRGRPPTDLLEAFLLQTLPKSYISSLSERFHLLDL